MAKDAMPEPAAAAAPPLGAAAKKRRRKRSAAEAAAVGVPPEEAARRARQRALRDTALKLRAQGQDYNAKKFRRKAALAAASAGALRPEHKPRRSVQVIVVPIFWNRQEEQKALVMGAAARAQAALRAAGVKADTDTTTKLTPGQKFRAWEEKGVRVRVEVGPQEAEQGVCLLALCTTPGEVAEKRRKRIGAELVAAVGEALGQELDAAAGEAAAEETGRAVGAPPSSKHTTFGDDEEGGEAVEEGEGGDGTKGGPQKASGDDLDGDFDEGLLLGRDGGGGGGGGGKKKKMGAAEEEPAAAWPEEEEGEKRKKKKKEKVVKFP